LHITSVLIHEVDLTSGGRPLLLSLLQQVILELIDTVQIPVSRLLIANYFLNFLLYPFVSLNAVFEFFVQEGDHDAEGLLAIALAHKILLLLFKTSH